MKKFTHFDDPFDISQTNNYELNIQFGHTGFSFVVNSLQSNKCVAIGLQEFGGSLHLSDLPQRLSSFLDSQEFLSKNFSKVNFIYTSAKSTLVPEKYFHKDRLKETFSFNHTLSVDDNLEYSEHRELKIFQLFAFPASLATIIINRFKDVNFTHQSEALLINFTKKETVKEPKPILLAHFTDELVDIVVSHDQKLILHNTFEAASDSDRVYYIAFVLKQLKLVCPDTQIFLSGAVSENSELYTLIKDNVCVGSTPRLYANLQKEISLPVAKHEFINLINL